MGKVVRKVKKFAKENMNSDNGFYRFISKTYKKLSTLKYKLQYENKFILHIKKYIDTVSSCKKAIKEIRKNQDNEYIVFYNPDWLGVANSTKGLFNSNIPLKEVYSKRYRKKIINEIAKYNFKSIIFSQIVDSWIDLILDIKKELPDVKIKVIWHANNFETISDYTWKLNKDTMELYESGKIHAMAFVKKSMKEFYSKKGYNAYYFLNTVNIDKDLGSPKKSFKDRNDILNNEINIGVYNAHSRELKNIYTQMLTAGIFKHATIDIVPATKGILEYADTLGIKYTYVDKFIKTEDLLRRTLNNDINIYTTFTECSPMFPLESFEVGVPCLIGNNNDYFDGSKLRDYVVVTREDDPIEIYNKIINVLENKEEVLALYKEWKAEFDKELKADVERFIKS